MDKKDNNFRPMVFLIFSLGLSLSAYTNASLIASDCNADGSASGKSFMTLETASKAKCLDSGSGEPSLTGKLEGNPQSDDAFLKGNYRDGFSFLGKNDYPGTTDSNLFNLFFSDDEKNKDREWSFDNSLWSQYSNIAIGFKFGGGQAAAPDTWFVYELNFGDSSGLYEYSAGKGLSHVNLYVKNGVEVPEPATLSLLSLGILALTVFRRKIRTT